MARAIDAYALNNDFVEWYNDLTNEIAKSVLRKIMQKVNNAPTLTQPNEPLTLEQLREMNEEPVWVQDLEEPEKSQWRLLYWDRGKYLVLQGISVHGYLLDEYGETWLAYRRPKEEDEVLRWTKGFST